MLTLNSWTDYHVWGSEDLSPVSPVCRSYGHWRGIISTAKMSLTRNVNNSLGPQWPRNVHNVIMLISGSWSLLWRHSSNCPGSQVLMGTVSCVTSPWQSHNAHIHSLDLQCHKDVPYLAVWSSTDDIAPSCDHVSPCVSLCVVSSPHH